MCIILHPTSGPNLVRGDGVATIVVDKDISSLSRIADRFLVMSKGCVVFSGTPQALAQQPEILERHLGI
jgi:branched-chain amino acid transport system ATP-binding protein